MPNPDLSWRPFLKVLRLSRPALGVTTAAVIVTLTACGFDLAPTPTPTSPKAATSAPTPTPTSPKAATSAPTATPAPATTSAPTAVPEPSAAEGLTEIPKLEIAEIPGNLPDYERDDWKRWRDDNGDCQNTRAEVLIEESTEPVTFTRTNKCTVAGGRWEGAFTGKTFTEAGDLDVDHMVPLANAHRSGGWEWSGSKKGDYYNSMDYDNHLIAVSKSANRSKGARGPEDWRPPDQSYHCQYARDWINIKDKWGLTATAAEWAALEKMLAKC